MARQITQYDPGFGYRFIPDLRARIPHESGGYLIRTNEAGFRSDRSFTPARRGACRRVLIFGDSYTAGDGVSNARRWTDLLETQIPALEVYNFGLSGSGTDQQYLIWRECSRGIEHDAVLIAVCVENVRRVVSRYRTYLDENGRRIIYAKPYFTLDAGELNLRHVPPPPKYWREDEFPQADMAQVDQGGRFPLLRTVARRVGAKGVLQRLTRYQPVPEYDKPSDPAWLLMRAILKQWIGSVTRPVLLMPIPLYQHVEEISDARPYRARFGELASELGCVLHDPLPDLLSYPAAERRGFRFQNDPHHTPEGHAALAGSLAPALARLLDQRGQDAAAVA